jgi:hypothetical protein
MIGEHRIFFVDGMKIIGQIAEVTANVVVVLNPVEIQYEDTENGQMIMVCDIIKESHTNLANILKSRISMTCDVSPEMISYYNIIVESFYDHRERTKDYLSSLTNIVAEQRMAETIDRQLEKGKLIQATTNNLN